ncbi:MAG: cytochrome c oxidase subunit II transmembrane domain-containing protein [bacterium]
MRKLFPALLSLLVAFLAAPASAGFGMPHALTSRGQLVEGLYNTIALLGTIVFTIVFVWLVVVIVRFREGSGHGRATHEKERHNLNAEITWVVIPLIMVLWIGYAAYGGLVQLDHGIDPKDVHIEIRITASQWNWEADYGHNVRVESPADLTGGPVSAANTFWVPRDEPIRFNITSADVIHAWQVLDANRAYVMFVDANPLGANKYNDQTVSLPEGDYLVQCNKMCLNPGHAYMHAAIKSVPRPMYDMWLLHHQLQAMEPAASVVMDYDATITATGLSLTGDQTVVSGARIILNVTNPTAQPANITWNDQPFPSATLAGAGPNSVPAGGQAFFAVDVPPSGSPVLGVQSAGHVAHVTFNIVHAELTEVRLGEFRLIPDHVDFTVGKTYLVTLKDVHTIPHNLYIGTHGGNVLASSATIAGGSTGSFLFVPTADMKGNWEMWCNITGHFDAGMHGTVTIS